MLAIKTILHPVDFSESSTHALQLACGLAADYNAHLVVIHVIASPTLLLGDTVRSKPTRPPEEIRGTLKEMKMPDEEADTLRFAHDGNPAQEILSMAQLCHADLIVMGSRGKKGSVAEAVMRNATCPVLTVTMQIAGTENADGCGHPLPHPTSKSLET